jgi:hypothetical protein
LESTGEFIIIFAYTLYHLRFKILDDERLTVSAIHFSIDHHHFANWYELNELSFLLTAKSMLEAVMDVIMV